MAKRPATTARNVTSLSRQPSTMVTSRLIKKGTIIRECHNSYSFLRRKHNYRLGLGTKQEQKGREVIVCCNKLLSLLTKNI